MSCLRVLIDDDLINIIISVYNGESFIEEQINSIFRQKCNNLKIFIRDDGSSDNTVRIIKEISKKSPNKVIVVKDCFGNLNVKESYFLLMQHGDTDYLLFCDQDDVWLPDKIEKTLAAMRAAEERYGANTPLLVHTDLCVVDRDLQPISPSFWKYQNLNPQLGAKLNRVMPQNVVTGCTMMINKPLAKLAAPIPEDAIMHDWWLALVAALFGQVVYLEEATILYRQHSENSVGAKRWGLKRIITRAQSPQEVRASMLRTMRQAQALLDRFRDKMSPEQIALVEAYARLPFMSKTARVGTMFKYRFFKHGMIRNVGFLSNLLMLDRSIQ